jgi:hypothetical protein
MENENQRPEGTNSQNGPDKDVTLNYIDKMFGALINLWGVKNRVGVIAIVLSSLLLVISVGWVSTKPDFSLGGLGLKMTFSAVLAGSMVFVTALVAYYYFLHVRSEEMAKEIIDLYGTLNYSTENMRDLVLGPFESMDPLITFITPLSSKSQPTKRFIRFFNGAVGIFVLLVLHLALPIVAESAAILRLASIVGWERFWIWMPFVLLVVITITVSIAIWSDDRT